MMVVGKMINMMEKTAFKPGKMATNLRDVSNKDRRLAKENTLEKMVIIIMVSGLIIREMAKEFNG